VNQEAAKVPKAANAVPSRYRNLPWFAAGLIFLVLAILGAAVAVVTFHLRKVVRAQLVQQDGMLLYAASLAPDSALEDLDPELANDPTVRFAVISDKLLDAAKRRSVVGVRFFDENGALQISIPRERGDTEMNVTAAQLEKLHQFTPISSFNRNADLSDLGGKGHAPLIRALVPLQENEGFAGVAEFMLDGSKVSEALGKLDRDLERYAILIFLAGGGLTAASLGWAFRRLQQTNRSLVERTESLLRANHELTLSAKTSAIGAITAHLIHDLKSPLFGLQSFVASRAAGDDQDWAVAIDSAARMQKMIAEVVRILQEDKASEAYELSLPELISVFQGKVSGMENSDRVEFEIADGLGDVFTNRDANILLLIMTNLVQNALHATPRDGVVFVRARKQAESEGGAVFEVSDTGKGLPRHVLSNLFTPCRSTKSGGTGLGLAISKQLAAQIGAELSLKETSERGTTFQLGLPRRAEHGNENTKPELLSSPVSA
jgi:signal transduction histidine kinase